MTIFTAFSGIIHDISCILGYGNYPEGYPSGYSGYGYGGQASTTPVSTPVATQPAPITGLEFFLFDYDLQIDFEYVNYEIGKLILFQELLVMSDC